MASGINAGFVDAIIGLDAIDQVRGEDLVTDAVGGVRGTLPCLLHKSLADVKLIDRDAGFKSYVNASWVHRNHVGVDSLIRETSLGFKCSWIVAGAMIGNEKRLWCCRVIVGRQVNSVVTRASAALKMEFTRLAYKTVRLSTARRPLLDRSSLTASKNGGGRQSSPKRF